MLRTTAVYSEEPASEVRCRDRCGAAMASGEAAVQAGWEHLQISGGWRCGACAGALWRASKIVGTQEPRLCKQDCHGSVDACEYPKCIQQVDALPPTSRGALPKETATTIVAPAVRG
jgi:hypothetical protein